MNEVLLAGEWLATVWIHFFILSLTALLISLCVGFRQLELRDAAWKAALLCGILSASVHLVLPGVGWSTVVMPPGREMNSPIARSAETDPARPASVYAGATEVTPSRSSEQPWFAATDVVTSRLTPFTLPSLHSLSRYSRIALPVGFGIGLLVGLSRLAFATWHQGRLVGRARACERADVRDTFERLRSRLGIKFKVDLLVSDETAIPMASGIVRPRLIIPVAVLNGALDDQQLAGLFAHELAHHKRRDPMWTVIGHLITHAFWFQPLGHVVLRNMRGDAEYLADSLACRALGGGLGLARCLATMAEWLVPRCDARLGIGRVHLLARRASLTHRVESLLVAESHGPPPTLVRRFMFRAAIVVVLALMIAAAPVVRSESPFPSQPGELEVNRTLAALALAATLTAPAVADEQSVSDQDTREAVSEPMLPESVRGFNGMIVGTVVSKDTESATLVLKVHKVTNVWKNSKAERPRDLVGATVKVEKFFGRFLDVLLVVKPGDTVELEARHVRGEHLQFPGEHFKKVEPVSTEDSPQPSTPDKPAAKPTTEDGDPRAFPAGLRGFRGMFVGKVVKTEVEKGVLHFQVESVKNVWPQNKAKDPSSSKGKTLTVNGIAGKWLDVLLVLKPGDRVEVEAFHNRGEALDFVQEWLKKID